MFAAKRAFRDSRMQEEPLAKWPLVTLARVREAQATLQCQQPPPPRDARQQQAPGAAAASGDADTAGTGASVGVSGAGALPDTAAVAAAADSTATAAQPGPCELYERLGALDPMRSGYYADAAAGRARVVLRAAGAA